MVNPSITKDAWDIVVHFICANLGYEDCSKHLKAKGYYVPKDLYETLDKAFSITMDLDIGDRRNETYP